MKFNRITESEFEDAPGKSPFGKWKDIKAAISEEKKEGYWELECDTEVEAAQARASIQAFTIGEKMSCRFKKVGKKVYIWKMPIKK